MNEPTQQTLFEGGPVLPPDFLYQPDFISQDQEQLLLNEVQRLPLQQASYREWTAKRRIISYGAKYDFSHLRLRPADPVPALLHPLRDAIAAWAGLPAADFEQASIAEYRPGTQLGWHRDVPDFELIAGISIAGIARMRFRPYPPAAGVARATSVLDLLPRSAYIIGNVARWKWQHAISPTKGLRYSITFRTRRTSKY